jgi:peptidoglycan L-alanyl-D-glutamate endopeptidase CwlK
MTPTSQNSVNPADAEPALITAYNIAAAAYLASNPTHKVRIVQTFRSNAVQDCLYEQGRLALFEVNKTRRGLGLAPLANDAANYKVTNSRGGQSKHNIHPSKAIDIAITVGKNYAPVESFRQFAKLMGTANPQVKWGGTFRNFADNPHFELP